jgi:hypothetical protein
MGIVFNSTIAEEGAKIYKMWQNVSPLCGGDEEYSLSPGGRGLG